MNVSLTPRNQNLIRELIERGVYPDADTVVGEALELLEERERLSLLRAKLINGVNQLERGEGVQFTAEWSEDRVQIARNRAEIGEVPNPDVCP